MVNNDVADGMPTCGLRIDCECLPGVLDVSLASRANSASLPAA